MKVLERLQRKLIFFPTKLNRNYRFEHPFKEVFLQTKDGVQIHGLFLNLNKPVTILYFHGNSGDLSSWQYVLKELEIFGCNVFIIDYREYGKSSGEVSEKGLYLDAEAAFDYLLDIGMKAPQIIIYGRSIGTGIAVELAKNHPEVMALILETPYTSLLDVFKHYVPLLLPNLWLQFHLNSLKKIKELSCPLLVIHGTNDKVIPYAQGLKIFNEYKSSKNMITIEGGEHNNLYQFGAYKDGLISFLATLR